MSTQRRDILKFSLAAATTAALPAAPSLAQAPAPASTPTPAPAKTGGNIDPRDRVFITNEDSNTLVVIDPNLSG